MNLYRTYENPINNINKPINNNAISFASKKISFEEVFAELPFKKLIKEGLPGAYSGIRLLPPEELKTLESLDMLTVPLKMPFDYLLSYKDMLFKNAKELINDMKKIREKNPYKTIQDIIYNLFPKAETNLQDKQLKILCDAIHISEKLPKDDYQKVKNLLETRLCAIFNPNNEKTVIESSDLLISQVLSLGIGNKKITKQICNKLKKLPSVSNSKDALICYCNNGDNSSQNIILKLLKLITATKEHIYPQSEQKKNNPNKKPWIYIYTTATANNNRKSMPFEQFMQYSIFPIKKNLQKHIDRLIEIHEIWTKNIKNTKSKKNIDKNKRINRELALYILMLKQEIEKRAPGFKINVDKLENSLGKTQFESDNNKVKKWLETQA